MNNDNQKYLEHVGETIMSQLDDLEKYTDMALNIPETENHRKMIMEKIDEIRKIINHE